MANYRATVSSLLRMVYDHELGKITEDFERIVNSWATYLENVLSVPEADLIHVYKKALDYRNENKVSTKFRLQDMQAVWSEVSRSGDYKKNVPVTICSICNNTGKFLVYDIHLAKEVYKQCNH